MKTPSRRLLRSAAALFVALVVTACGGSVGRPGGDLGRPTFPPGATSTPTSATPTSAAPSASTASPTPGSSGSVNPADAKVYAQIEAQVRTLRQLGEKKPVNPVLLDEAGVAAYLQKANAQQTDHEALATQSRLYVDLGLLPAGSSLEALELSLSQGQVVGFYDPSSKGLYVLSGSGGVGGMEKLIFSHEYTHALQDQNFDLSKLQNDTTEEDDFDLARTALPEGDASLLMTQWAVKYMSMAEMLGIAWQSLSGPQSDQLAAAPPILRQTLGFPYNYGLTFVQSIYAKGGWAAVDKIYANPPVSTSQILHPEQYAQNERPVAMSVPDVPADLAGWKKVTENTFGEFELGIWLAGPKENNAGATEAVTTWAGDRAGLYEGPNGQWAVVVATAWRSPGGATAFRAAAKRLLGQMGSASRICSAPGNDRFAQGETIVLASDASLVSKLATCPA